MFAGRRNAVKSVVTPAMTSRSESHISDAADRFSLWSSVKTGACESFREHGTGRGLNKNLLDDEGSHLEFWDGQIGRYDIWIKEPGRLISFCC